MWSLTFSRHVRFLTTNAAVFCFAWQLNFTSACALGTIVPSSCLTFVLSPPPHDVSPRRRYPPFMKCVHRGVSPYMTASHSGGIPYYDVSPQRGYPSFMTTVYIGGIPFHDVKPPPRQLLTGRWVRVRLKLRVLIFHDANPPTPDTTLHLDT